ncbi:glycosyltransferase family 1 protein [Pisolithus tinctorius]|uniref:UDP-N-acetylglucosamine transferase subunit ALG13 n=1 Tax=Pisolithus tinctorius Marx 270 TaxID=870435 RepID=A0A0C3KVJ5_PISTI|nr:glycosyltransferase family 1 protein [Pisolithus tinctorius]KIO13597.1 glycosyltransferase family 1 protein [Pisolithus tinctorius Marx 270]
MLVFVTVGSTRFDALVQTAISEQVLDALHKKGYRRIAIQRGNSDLGMDGGDNGQDLMVFETNGMEVETWKFKTSILSDIQRATLVVSHAGSGTILDALRQGKPMIVVPNPTLLDDHQGELSSRLDALGYLKATTVNNLAVTISAFDPSSLIPFPPFDGSRFRRLIDQEMGYSVSSS